MSRPIFESLVDDPRENLSILQDPFHSEAIQRVMLVWSRNMLLGRVRIYGTVAFQAGQTTGEQTIEADTMGELIEKVKAFIETLPEK